MINVTPGNPQLEGALVVLMVMTFYLMALASSQQKIVCLLTQDVVPGTGRIRNAFNAQTTGSSIPTVSAFLFQINVIPLIDQEAVFLAMLVTAWFLENAS